MFVKMLKAKLHGLTATECDLHYEGSILVDGQLLELAGIVEHEEVQVWNRDNGQRFSTYAIADRPGSGRVMVNGAAAHLVKPGHTLIVAAYVYLAPEGVKTWQPRVVLVGPNNQGRLKA